jgi:HSP20 family protein
MPRPVGGVIHFLEKLKTEVRKMLRIWDPLREMEAFDRDIDRLFSRTSSAGFPPVNVFVGEGDVIVTSEIPGIEPNDIDLSVAGEILTLKGARKPLELKEGETWHRRERGYGNFVRTVRLPYTVDGSKVEAKYENGILKVTLPRAEADKPRKISVRTSE